jgi:hypothetical protein
MNEAIRYSKDGMICIVWDTISDKAVRCVTQDDMDTLPVVNDLMDDEIETLDE